MEQVVNLDRPTRQIDRATRARSAVLPSNLAVHITWPTVNDISAHHQLWHIARAHPADVLGKQGIRVTRTGSRAQLRMSSERSETVGRTESDRVATESVTSLKMISLPTATG